VILEKLLVMLAMSILSSRTFMTNCRADAQIGTMRTTLAEEPVGGGHQW
jgi:hypothetical protein